MKEKMRIDGIVVSYFPNEANLEEICHGFIYVTKCVATNKYYVGKSKFHRQGNWRQYLGSGYDLKADLKKYGAENFKRIIIDVASDDKELTKLEGLYIQMFEAIEKENWYNSPRKRHKHGLKPFTEVYKDW